MTNAISKYDSERITKILLQNLFRRTTEPRPWLIFIAVLSLLSLTIFIAVYFYQVNSTLADATWGDASWYNQMAYNFTHGKPLQTSIYRLNAPGVPDNPFPYIHSFSIHVNFTPYLLLWAYKFMPTVNGLYLIVILFNVAGFLGIGWLLARRLFPDKDRFLTYALVCALFFCALPFAETITYKGQFALFAGPFILAAYYFWLRDNKLMLALSALLVCAVSEDQAIFMISFSAYLFLFEGRRRQTALWLGLGSAIYLALVWFVIQPAAHSGVALTQTSNVMAVFHRNIPELIFFGFDVALYFIRLGVALAVMALLANFRKGIDWKKPLGLIIIAPASHWFIVAVRGGGQHLMPILACTFLALLLIAAKLELRPVALVRLVAAALICLAVDLYVPVKRLPFQTDAPSLARMASNKSILREVALLPEEAGVSYWTNMGLDAFLTSRPNVWRFPEYFDAADYLVIQKDADRTFYEVKEQAPGSITAAIKAGRYYSTGSKIAIPPETVQRLERELVNVQASHEVKTDSAHVLILKRKESAGLPNPASTVGLSWIKNIGSGGKIL